MNSNLVKRRVSPELRAVIGAADWRRISDGMSDAAVFRLAGEETRYLKVIPVDTLVPAADEVARLRWLQTYVPVPQVLHEEHDEAYHYLLLSEIAGIHPFHDALSWSAEERIIFLADAAKRFHSIPLDDCPFDWRIDAQLAAVERTIERGQVRVDLWETEHRDKTIEQLYDELVSARPADEDLAVVHGDLYPVNIHALPETHALSGYIDVGAAGIADRYTDLALCAQAIGWHFGDAYLPLFFERYGISLDAQKLRFYQLLSEFR